MGKVESPFVISPHKYQELTQPDMCYYIVVAKEDEAKVKEAMKHYPEIEVAGYTDGVMNIVAVRGEVMAGDMIPWESGTAISFGVHRVNRNAI